MTKPMTKPTIRSRAQNSWRWLSKAGASAMLNRIACLAGGMILMASALLLEGDLWGWFEHDDKVRHVLAFFALSVFALWRSRAPAIRLACLVALAIGVELAQHFVPGRKLSLADLAASLVGVGLGLGLAWAWTSRRRETTQ